MAVYLTSSAVIPSVIRGGCYVLTTVTPSEIRSASIAVYLPSVLQGASHYCMSRTVSGPCLLCYQLVTVSGQLQLIKSFFPSIRLPDVICVELVYQHHKLQRIQRGPHRLTAAVSSQRSCTVGAGPVGDIQSNECSRVHLNAIRQMLQ